MDQEQFKKEKKKKRGIKKTILTFILVFLLIVTGASAGIVVAVVKSAPVIDTNILNNLEQTSMLYDKDGNLLERVRGESTRSIVTLDKIPKNLQNAFVAIEDERFYSHGGIDIKRIIGASFHNVRTMSKSQGASTITQQLIKNYALSQDKKFTRKFQEMYLAMQLEDKLSKKQILEAYLNTIFLGGRNVNGVKSAAEHYFGDKATLDDLSLAECALIAGITQNPYKYYPYSESNLKDNSAYIERQHLVLDKMLELGFINQKQCNEAKAEKLNFKDSKPISTGKYQWFVDPALEEIHKDLSVKEGISVTEAARRVSSGGYKIYLTIDTELQNSIQEVINDPKYYSGVYVPKEFRNYSSNPEADDDDKKIQPQVAAAIFDYNTGAMRAIIGGREEHKAGALNRATKMPRQPGSTIKPLAVYGPAFDKGLVDPNTIISGAKFTKSEIRATGFNPKNSTSDYPEALSVRQAIVSSTNTVAARVAMKVTPQVALDYLKNKFHFSTVSSRDAGYGAFSLGGMTEGLLATEMAAAYGVFGNNGEYTEPYLYTKVVDRTGKVILENKTTKSKALSPTAAYTTLDAMQGVVLSGTGKEARFGDMPTAGKTGTTNDAKTVWFSGLTPYYSGAVWIGHDKPSLKITGLKSSTTARLWADMMSVAHKGLDYKGFIQPSGFVSALVCPTTGKLYSDSCKAAGLSPVTSYFSPDSKPTQMCAGHGVISSGSSSANSNEETGVSNRTTRNRTNRIYNNIDDDKPSSNKSSSKNNQSSSSKNNNSTSSNSGNKNNNGSSKPKPSNRPDNNSGNSNSEKPSGNTNSGSEKPSGEDNSSSGGSGNNNDSGKYSSDDD